MSTPTVPKAAAGDHAAGVPTASETRALGFLAIAAVVALIRLAAPVGVGLFLGVLLAFTLQPLYGRLRTHRWRAVPAAVLCSLGATAIASAAVVGLGVLFVTHGVALVEALAVQLAPGGPLRALALRNLTDLHVDASALAGRLQDEVVSLGSRAAGIAANAAGATFGGMVTLFFMTLTTYFVLLHWNEIVQRAERTLPFEARHTHALLGQFRRVGRQVLRGTLVTGFVQGAFATLGYWMTGVPQPLFFGALTAVASMVPAVGTLLVWIPIGIYRVATGHTTAGVLELVYCGAFVVVVSDYVVRPKLVGREAGVPALLTFVSFFGGVEVFGLVGLILGPVIVTLSAAILKTYEAEVLARDGM
jgi:predicted PurR-regulated permease PerM